MRLTHIRQTNSQYNLPALKPPSCFWSLTHRGRNTINAYKNKYGPGKALTVLAHKLARAVYDLLKRQTMFNMDTFMRGRAATWVSLLNLLGPIGMMGF